MPPKRENPSSTRPRRQALNRLSVTAGSQAFVAARHHQPGLTAMQTAKREIAVSMTDISKRFGPVRALENANLQIARGSILGLVGQNGAGKSTIIKVLAGIIKPDSGTIVI